MIKIVETFVGDPHFQQFVDFPQRIYPVGSPKFAFPEQIPEKHLTAHYLVLSNGIAVGRASLYSNPDLSYQKHVTCTIGNYECQPDDTYAAVLLEKLITEAAIRGANYLIGPMNGSTWENYRFATSHDHPPFFTEPYHHLYYHGQFRQAGFGPLAEYFTNRDTSLTTDRPDIVQREKALRALGMTVRPINLNRYEEEISRIYEFNKLAFKTNFLFTPISQSAFCNKYASAVNFLNPAFTLVAEDDLQNIIGFYFCFDDVLNTSQKSLIAKTLARHPAPKWHGLGHVMGNLVVRKAAELGYESMLHPFIFSQGTSTRLSESFSGKNYRNYLLYGRPVFNHLTKHNFG